MIRSTASALVLLAAASVDARPVTVPVGPGDGVKLARAVFLDAAGDAHDLPEAIATIDRAALAEATGLRRGYLQVITEMGPVAYDVPIRLDDSETLPRALRGLRIRHGDAESDFQIRMPLADDADGFQLAQVAFTSEPLFDMRNIDSAMRHVPLTTFPLAVQYQAIGGDAPGGQFAPPPVGPLPPPPPVIDAGDMADVQYTQPTSWNVETAWNQCVPSAFANTLAYMEGTFGQTGINFPQQHIPGIGTDGSTDSLVGELDRGTGRIVQSTCVGGGVNRCGTTSTIRGIFSFLDEFDGDGRIDLAHQDGDVAYPGTCAAATDRQSQREGARVSWDWLCDRVQDGDGLFMSFGFYSPATPINNVPQWTRTGGHAVRVFGCSAVGAQRFLHILDDGLQDQTQNFTCQLNAGLRTQVLPVLSNPTTQGRLLLGGTGQQIEFAMSFTPNQL